MKTADGIVIFGANGSGKTVLGRELSNALGFKHIDVEDYCFDKSDIFYRNPREKDDVIRLMLADIEQYGSFVLSGVTGDYGDEIFSMYKLAVLLSAPIDLRIERIRKRAVDKHGGRVLPNGDMYENSENFISFARTRDLSVIDRWADTLLCPVIGIDSTKPIAECFRTAVDAYYAL